MSNHQAAAIYVPSPTKKTPLGACVDPPPPPGTWHVYIALSYSAFQCQPNHQTLGPLDFAFAALSLSLTVYDRRRGKRLFGKAVVRPILTGAAAPLINWAQPMN